MGKEKEKESSEEYVSIKHLGPMPHVINYREKRGMKTINPGETENFNIRDKEELAVLLGILKTINTEKGVYNTTEYKDNSDKAQPTKYRRRFVVEGGLENLPKVLREIQFTKTRYPSPGEREAILKLVPNYYEREDVVVRVKR